MSTKNLTAALRAPFYKRFLGRSAVPTEVDYAYDNNFALRWRNAADSADVDALRVNASDQVELPAGVVVGDAVTDAMILKGRVATGSAAGAALTLGATYLYGEGNELRYSISAWTGIGNQFNGLYMRAESAADNAAGSLRGAEFYAAANASAVSDLKGILAYAYIKGDTAETIDTVYGSQSEFSMDAGRANAITLTEAAALMGKITGGKVADYTKIHGLILRAGDMDGQDRTLGNAILIDDDAAMAGVPTWTAAIRLTAPATNLLSFDAAEGCVSAIGGTLTATHKIAINIDGVGTIYIPAGTVA